MDHRTLGRSGCTVSSLCLGTMIFARNHGICTHGVHHTSTKVSARYAVTIQDAITSA
jgi:aryl-alcohol dehydrogenase-like predicted oxidoreductase